MAENLSHSDTLAGYMYIHNVSPVYHDKYTCTHWVPVFAMEMVMWMSFLKLAQKLAQIEHFVTGPDAKVGNLWELNHNCSDGSHLLVGIIKSLK